VSGNGDDALVTFAMMAQGKMEPAEVERKWRVLLEYFERDTLAMVIKISFQNTFEPIFIPA